MNIDVRSIKGKVLECMEKLIEEHKFTSTAKATRFVIVDYFKKLETIEKQQNTIKALRKELEEKESALMNSEKFKKHLKKFISE